MSLNFRMAVHPAASSFDRLRAIHACAGVTLIAAALFFGMTQGSSAHSYEAGEIEIIHPSSRPTPDGARVAAGYFVLKNNGSEADRLIGTGSEISGRAEIHEMSVNAEGVMTMRPVADGLEIPAGGEVALEPGGYHIMFLELERGLAEGDRFAGTLTFEKAGEVEVEYSVDPLSGGEEHDGHDH